MALSDQFAAFLAAADYQHYIIVAHSFTALNWIPLLNEANKHRISGFVGLDPTTPAVMKKYPDELPSLLKEQQEAAVAKQKKMTPEVAEFPPHLTAKSKAAFIAHVQHHLGSPELIWQMQAAPKTVAALAKSQVANQLPTLSILSSLNYPSYCQLGNPYFTTHPNSQQLVLVGHHFIHWLHPHVIANQIIQFISLLQ